MPDSSSFHSNESNESHRHSMRDHATSGQTHSDHNRGDIETLNEEEDDKGEESEYVCDSEYDERCSEPQQRSSSRVYNDNDLSIGGGLNSLDSGSDDYAYNPGTSRYLQHPNQYLPTYNIHSETEGETTSLNSRVPVNGLRHGDHRNDDDSDDYDEDDDVPQYGFPCVQNHKRRNRRLNGVQNCSKGEDNSLLCHEASNSDVSTNLCEIEESEYDQESQPLNRFGMHQTAV